MITMKPVLEQAVIDALNAGRFDGTLDGYVVLDGPTYLGHALYRVEHAVTTVLECCVQNTALVDGAVRACVAAGENAGATQFSLRVEDEALEKWFDVFCKNEQMPLPNEKIFHQCK